MTPGKVGPFVPHQVRQLTDDSSVVSFLQLPYQEENQASSGDENLDKVSQ